MKASPSIRVFSSLLLVFAFASATALAMDDDQSLSPYFQVTGDPEIDRLPLKKTDVEIAISGVIADVSVTQTYRNEGRRPINATYIFPASVNAAVYSMRMKIGNEVIVARIKKREVAKREFEAAKKQGKSASLLEQQRPNVFSMNMANLMPNEVIEIELRYTEILIPTKGVYEMVYPTVVGPRYKSNLDNKSGKAQRYMKEGKNPDSELHISARINAGLPLQDLKCVSHKITPDWIDPTVAGLQLDDDSAFEGNRDFILQYSLAGKSVESGLLLFEGEKENFFLYMVQPPARVDSASIPAREYVFVIDVSGSMEGYPLETSKKLLGDLLGQLNPSDFFNVILFSGDSTALSETPIQASDANLSRAIQLIEEQRGLGGTELLSAMQQATRLPKRNGVSRSIVLITDGYISAEADVFDFIRNNIDQTNIFSFGIGTSVNRYLIDGVAKAGMGEPFVLTNESDASNVATRFREYIQSPVMTNISIIPSDFEAYDVIPLKQPDLFAERPIVLFGKWRGPVTGTFNLKGQTGNGVYKSTLDISGVVPNVKNTALRYLWARSRIAELSDYGASSPSDKDIEAITSLGIKYNLLTRYTSFIAVRELVTNPDGSAADIKQRLPLPLGVSNMAVGSEPGLTLLVGIGSFLALLLFVLFRFRMLLTARRNAAPNGAQHNA